MTTGRYTAEIVETLAKSTADTRVTAEIVETLVNNTADTRVTAEIIEVLVTLQTSTPIAADITATALVTANLIVPQTHQLAASINGTAVVTAAIKTPQPLVPNSLTGSATVTALLDKNIENTSSTLSFTQSATLVQLGGNTLPLSQLATVVIIVNPAASNTLTFTQNTVTVGTIQRSATNTIIVTGIAAFAHVLPVEAANSTITFTSTADFARAADSPITFTQTAIGSIGGLLEEVTQTVSFVSTVALDNVLLRSLTDTLILTQVVDSDLDIVESASNGLSFNQNALHITLGAKTFVILQAPFNFLQTSIVLPAPLFGDTENITNEMSLRRSMNGVTRTYIKTNSHRRLTYTFRLNDDLKSLELLEFLRFYNSDLIRLTNWKGEVWKVNLLSNPIDLVQTRRFGTDISLEFEGERIQ